MKTFFAIAGMKGPQCTPVLPIGAWLEDARIYELEQLLVELPTHLHVGESNRRLLTLRVGDDPLPEHQRTVGKNQSERAIARRGGAHEAQLYLARQMLHPRDRHVATELHAVGEQDAKRRLADGDIGGLIERLVVEHDETVARHQQ